jgi:rhodanese-related sulfurtransferase
MTVKTMVSTAVAAMLLAAVPAVAQTGETPEAFEGAKVVTVDQVKAEIGKVAIYDVRRRAAYVEGRLPGAQSIARHVDQTAQTCDAAAAFGPDKAKPIVIHGHGTDGWSAFYCVREAVKAGFTDVRWLRAGFAGWTAAGNALEK